MEDRVGEVMFQEVGQHMQRPCVKGSMLYVRNGKGAIGAAVQWAKPSGR